MSAIGPKRTSQIALHMSAFGGKAHIIATCASISESAASWGSDCWSCTRAHRQEDVPGDKAAKIIASVIIAGIALMFGYGVFGWMIFGR